MTKDELGTKAFNSFYNVITDRIRPNAHCFVVDSSEAEYDHLETLKRLRLVYLDRKKNVSDIQGTFTQLVYKLTEFGYKMKQVITNVELSENEQRGLFAKQVYEYLQKSIK